MDSRRLPLSALAFIFLLACGGCAALGDGDKGGGGSNLPNRGFLGYEPLNAEDEDGSPVVLAPPEGERWENPSAVVRGDRVEVFFERISVDDVHEVFRAVSDDGGVQFSSPQRVLAPAQVAETDVEGRLLAPSVIFSDGRYLMTFGFGADAGIGLASSVDGVAFEVDPSLTLRPRGADEAAGVAEPTLVVSDDGEMALYYVGRESAEGGLPLLMRAVFSDGDWQRDGVVLSPPEECLDAFSEPETCWDAEGIVSPEVRLVSSATGRRLWRLSYSAGGEEGVGFAASWDGIEWTRFEFNPRLDGQSQQPTNVQWGEKFLLFYLHDRGSDVGIALAVSDSGHPGEQW